MNSAEFPGPVGLVKMARGVPTLCLTTLNAIRISTERPLAVEATNQLSCSLRLTNCGATYWKSGYVNCLKESWLFGGVVILTRREQLK
jgi:hypothetical protein